MVKSFGFALLSAWTSTWTNSRSATDLIGYDAHVMPRQSCSSMIGFSKTRPVLINSIRLDFVTTQQYVFYDNIPHHTWPSNPTPSLRYLRWSYPTGIFRGEAPGESSAITTITVDLWNVAIYKSDQRSVRCFPSKNMIICSPNNRLYHHDTICNWYGYKTFSVVFL